MHTNGLEDCDLYDVDEHWLMHWDGKGPVAPF